MLFPLTVVDLFSGCGGLSLGFGHSGFTTVAAYDSWEPAVATHRVNLGEHVRKAFVTSDLDVPTATVFIGGPPCQGFSSAGPRRSNDARNTLISEFARLVARAKPVAFVFENVEGFLTSGDGVFVFHLLEPLIEAGYRIHLRKINAANYGVPQHRKRVIAIGGLGWDPSFPDATHAAFGAPGSQRANGAKLVPTPTFDEAVAVLPCASARDNSESISDHFVKPLVGDDLKRAQLLLPGQWMKDLPEELWHESYKRRAFRRVMDGTPTEQRGGAPAGIRRLRGDEPSKAITGGALRDFLHPKEDRPLTIRECATLQTFPTHFRFFGTQSEKIQLIGNAVPPLLASCIASSLKRDLDRVEVGAKEGALLSFSPTCSLGMSPALESVCDQIEERYGWLSKQQALNLAWH
jgi:DNA (cytosine-5)-methyltransferase 1